MMRSMRVVAPVLSVVLLAGCASSVERHPGAGGVSSLTGNDGVPTAGGGTTTGGTGGVGGGTGSTTGGATGSPTGSGSDSGSTAGSVPGGSSANQNTGNSSRGHQQSSAPIVPPAAPGHGDSQGVSASSVKIGFIAVDSTQGQASNNGFTASQSGDYTQLIKAVVKWANANGGIAGHQIVPVIKHTTISTESDSTEQQTCAELTQTDHVFGFVPMALIFEDARACYAQHHTLMVDPSAFPYDQTVYQRLAPYYWTSGFPSYDRVERALVSYAKSKNALSGQSIGIAAFDYPAYHRVTDSVLKPALQAAGVPANRIKVSYVDGSGSIAGVQSSTNNAVFSFSTARPQISRVFFLGTSLLAPFFMERAEAQQYHPHYLLNSYDQLQFLQQSPQYGPPTQLNNSTGIGFFPASDVDGSHYGWPSSRERPCLSIYRKYAGLSYNSHYDAEHPLEFCDAVSLLVAAGKRIHGALSVQSWAQAAASLGTRWQSATGFSDLLTGAKHDSAQVFRPLSYNFTGCRCFSYTGPPARFN